MKAIQSRKCRILIRMDQEGNRGRERKAWIEKRTLEDIGLGGSNEDDWGESTRRAERTPEVSRRGQ